MPFLVVSVLWGVVSCARYGVFLVTKQPNVSDDQWEHASVLVAPGLGFAAHLFKRALKV